MRYLVIDCNYLCHKSRFDTSAREYKGQSTKVIFGFMEKIVNLCESFRCNNLLFTWDSPSSVRKDAHGWYKQKRHTDLTRDEKEELEESYKQFQLLQYSILPSIGFKNIFYQEGMEGDDLMAQIVKQDPLGADYFYLVASDHDLYQLLNNHVSMLISAGDMFQSYTTKKFYHEYGITPNKWHLVKAIAGCKSDEVPGVGRDIDDPEILVTRIGEKTTCKYLQGELKETTKAYQRIRSKDGRKIKRRNLPLVTLPHEKTKEIDMVDDETNFKGFKDMCRKYGLISFLQERKDEWRRVIKGYEEEY